MEHTWKFLLVAPLLLGAPVAGADESDAAKVMSECGAQNLPQSSLDSCLERVRVIEETDPSADLQSLEASLERRATGRQPPRTTSARVVSAPPTELSKPAAAAPVDPSNEPAAEVPSTSQRLAGPDAEDQPPISDSDEGPPNDAGSENNPDSRE